MRGIARLTWFRWILCVKRHFQTVFCEYSVDDQSIPKFKKKRLFRAHLLRQEEPVTFYQWKSNHSIMCPATRPNPIWSIVCWLFILLSFFFQTDRLQFSLFGYSISGEQGFNAFYDRYKWSSVFICHIRWCWQFQFGTSPQNFISLSFFSIDTGTLSLLLLFSYLMMKCVFVVVVVLFVPGCRCYCYRFGLSN